MPRPGSFCVTSLLFKVRSVPAALYKALGGFATCGVNLTKIESYLVGGKFDAAQFYVLLTIGDGLVAQIPALLLSTAAAIIVTRASGSQNIGEQVTRQLFGNPQTLAVTAGIIGILGLITSVMFMRSRSSQREFYDRYSLPPSRRRPW